MKTGNHFCMLVGKSMLSVKKIQHIKIIKASALVFMRVLLFLIWIIT